MYQLGLREEDESRSQRSTRRVKLREAEADGEGFAEDEIGFFAFERAACGDEGDEVASGISGGQLGGDTLAKRIINVAEAVVGASGELHERELSCRFVQIAGAEQNVDPGGDLTEGNDKVQRAVDRHATADPTEAPDQGVANRFESRSIQEVDDHVAKFDPHRRREQFH